MTATPRPVAPPGKRQCPARPSLRCSKQVPTPPWHVDKKGRDAFPRRLARIGHRGDLSFLKSSAKGQYTMQPSATTIPPPWPVGFWLPRFSAAPSAKAHGARLFILIHLLGTREGGVGRRGDGQTGGTLIMQHMFIQRLAVRIRGSPRCPAVNARERGRDEEPFFPSPYAAASGQETQKKPT